MTEEERVPAPSAPAAQVRAEPSHGLRRSRLAWLVTTACILSLAGLGVTLVHLLWPTPLMFAMFMTVGQGSFAIAMALYLVVIFADLRRKRVL